jgi:hypothetical protein
VEYIRVNWWWLTLPLLPELLTVLFLAVIWQSRKMKLGNLKNSTLENMQVLSSEVRERLGMLSLSSKMEKDGENIHLILERDGEV